MTTRGRVWAAHLALCTLALLLAHTVSTAPEAVAQNAQIVVQDGPQAEQEKDESQRFRPEINTSIAAEGMLRLARNLAAAGGYPDASERLVDLVIAHPRAVSEAAEGYYLPLWRVAADEVLSWPVEGLRAYQEAVAPRARAEYADALQQGDPRELERVAQQYFLSEVGDNAAVIVGDRLRETGWPVLALFYYRLVLQRHPDCDMPRAELLLRAALAAREAGLDDHYKAFAEQLEDLAVQVDPTAGKVMARDWLATQAAQGARPTDPVGGFGNLTKAPAVAPATVTWEIRLAAAAGRRQGYWPATTNSSTPPVYPTLAGDTLYAANLHSAWAIDVRSGTTRWRYDTRETQGEALPPVSRAQARQPLVDGGVVYVPLEKPPPEKTNQQRNVFMRGAATAATDLYALDAATGQPLWRWGPRDGGLEFGALSVDGQPVVSGELLCVSLGSPSAFFGEVYTAAVDRRSGKLVWAQPLAAYLTNLSRERRGWSFSADVTGAALAARGGLLLSSGLGVTTAQSCLSGSVLWVRVNADMALSSPAPGAPRVAPRGGRRLIEGMALARRPRVLADRGIVVAGFALSPALRAYDWLDGRILWQVDASGARQPLAISNGTVIAWGQTLMAFDLQTGAPRRQSTIWPEPIIGEPVVTPRKVMAPTPNGITTLDLATGELELTSGLPADVQSGNLALTDYGLMILSASKAVCVHDWETAKEHFLAMAEEDPTDARPLITLGGAALRLEKTEEGLHYLDRAMERDPPEDLRAQAYELFEAFYRIAYMHSSTELIARLLNRLRESAGSGANLCRQAFLRAEYVSRRDPADAVAALQEVLDDPASRHVRLSKPAGPGVSGILAEEAIGRLMVRYGGEIYRPWERDAQTSRRKAHAANDYDALLEVAQRYPNSRASRHALDDALCLLLERKDLNEANRLLIRLVNLTPEGDRETRYRSLLVDTSLQLGAVEFAGLQASALKQVSLPTTRVPLADGRTATVDDVSRRVSTAVAAPHDTPKAPAVPLPPYRTAWQRQLEPAQVALRGISFLGNADEARDQLAQTPMLYLGSHLSVVALDRSNGQTVWEHKLNRGMPFRAKRCAMGRTGLYVGGTGSLMRLDKATGEPLWSIRLQPEGRSPLFAPRESVTGVLRYGDTGWRNGSRANLSRLNELGDKLIANSTYSLHVIDPRDGYTIQSIGYPYGVYYGGFIRYGHTAMGIPMRPTRMRQRILRYSLATGNLEGERRLGQNVLPSAVAPHGSRYWPMFLQENREVCIVDMANGHVSPASGFQGANPRVYSRIGLARDSKVVYVATPGTSDLVALDVTTGTTLWTYNLPDKQMLRHLTGDDEGRLIVTWPSGIAAVRGTDGHVLWKHVETEGKPGGTTIREVIGNHILVTISRRLENQYVNYTILMDKRTGKVVTKFVKPDEVNTQVLHIDSAGVLLQIRSKQSLEYWVHDGGDD